MQSGLLDLFYEVWYCKEGCYTQTYHMCNENFLLIIYT